ncbi:FGGY-family carbohydrate kinase [Companilactobacillus zhachilii]|uniref:FGGY-family carbohydrate kinase n=1 Tax=Companilactobacillus zhachilii TaxID=2304606 RepID=UPI0040339DE6
MILTIDVGTTNTKLTCWETYHNYKKIKQVKFSTPKICNNDYVDFDINSLWEKIISNIKLIGADNLKKVDRISIASVGEAGVLLDKNFQRIGPMIAWFDQRSQTIIDHLSKNEQNMIYQITGLPAHVHYSASKIAWLLKEYANTMEKYYWLCIPDYLLFLLTGNLATEYSIASRTLCYDLKTKEWSEEVKKIFNIENVEFPNVHSAGENMGTVQSSISKRTGLNSDCYVTIVGHDHMVGSRASSLHGGELLDSTGTTEALLTLKDDINLIESDEKKGIANGVYVDPKKYTLFTALPAAGSVIQWFMETLNISEEQLMDSMDKLYENYRKGVLPENITWLIPHFSGSGTPTKSTLTKGLWYGINSETTLDDLVFGLFLGLTFEFKLAMETLIKSDGVSCIKAIGPITNDNLWLQLKADILKKDIIALEMDEAVSFGGCLIANHSKSVVNSKSEIYHPLDNSNSSKLNKIFTEQYLPIYKSKVNFELNINN